MKISKDKDQNYFIVPQMLLLLGEVKLSLLQLPSLHQLQQLQVLAAETKIQTSSPLPLLPVGMYALHATGHRSYRKITNVKKTCISYKRITTDLD